MVTRAATRIAATVGALIGTAALISACGVYSFSGATIPDHLQTIAIPLVEDNSVNTLTALDEQFTEMLLQRFVRQTRLRLETSEVNADALLRVRLDRYANVPASVGGDERATLNRVTLAATVMYRDQTNDSDLLSRSFTAFEEYDPSDPELGLSGESDAAFAALEKIADDIFTAATSNW